MTTNGGIVTHAHVDKVLRLVAEQQVATGEHVSRRFIHHRLRDFDHLLVDDALDAACRVAELRSHGFPPNDAFQVCPAGIERCGPVGGRVAAFIEGVLRFYKAKSAENPDFRDFSWRELARFLHLDAVADHNFGIAALNIADIAGAGTASPASHEANYERPRNILAFLRCSEFPQYLQLFQPPAAPAEPLPAAVVHPAPVPSEPASDGVQSEGGRLRFLAVATEWDSAHGGLSTLNRQLCLALAAEGHEVVCAVHAASDAERTRALEGGVALAAQPAPGPSAGHTYFRRPEVPPKFKPDYVIGHGRVTGSEAVLVSEDHFKGSRRVHFIHMAPDEIEWLKGDRQKDAGERAEERTVAEVEFCREAHCAVAVGPRLAGRFATELSARGLPPPLRLDPGFDTQLSSPRSPPAGDLLRVLILGRAEDARLKGLDIAAKATGRAAEELGRHFNVELFVRGAPRGACESLREKLQVWAPNQELQVVVRPFTADAKKIEADIASASLLLMPSRTEGFGLVGLEAIAGGTPVIVSRGSGLGQFLFEEIGDEQSGTMVLPVSDDPGCVLAWAKAIVALLRDREAAFRSADNLRVRLSAAKPWRRAVRDLVAAIASETPRSSSAGSGDAARSRGASKAKTWAAGPDQRRAQDADALRLLLGHVSMRTVANHINEAANWRIDSSVFGPADRFDEYRQDPMFHIHDASLLQRIDAFREALSDTLNKSQWFNESADPRVQQFSKANKFSSYGEWQIARDSFSAAVDRCNSAQRAFLKYVQDEYPEVGVVALDVAALADSVTLPGMTLGLIDYDDPLDVLHDTDPID